MTKTTTPGDATAGATTAEQPTNHAMTPGPWAVADTFPPDIIAGASGGCSVVVACLNEMDTEGQAEANARAIAAVPALVEAVRKAAQYTEHPINSSDMRYAVQALCVAALKSAGVVA